jgi:hypothetical protein
LPQFFCKLILLSNVNPPEISAINSHPRGL